jgi:hypothetical protein
LSRWIERVGVAHEAQLDTWFHQVESFA